MKTKTYELYNASVSCQFCLIAFTETWLDSSVFDSELFSSEYSVFRKDRSLDLTKLTKGGGVLVALKKSFVASLLDLSAVTDLFPNIDLIGIKISLPCFSVYVLVLYIPPNINAETYESFFDALSANHRFYNEGKLIILGDFNIPNYIFYVQTHEVSSRQISSLTNFCELFGLEQYNYILNSNNRLLDLVLSRSNITVTKSENYLLAEDTHHPSLDLSFKYKSNPDRFVGKHLPSFNFRKANFHKFYNDLCNIDWASVMLGHSDVNEACDKFYANLNSVLLENVPRTTPRNTSYPPWFSKSIIKDIKEKSRLWWLIKDKGELNHLDHFRVLRSKIKRDITVAHKCYLENLEFQIKANPTSFWSFLNTLKNTTTIPSSMNYGNDILKDEQSIVNAFAHYFQSAFINSSTYDMENLQVTCNVPQLSIPYITEEDVLKALKKFKNKLTTGPDGIPAFLLKDCAVIFALPLSIIFNLSLQTATFPQIWSTSKICPVFKKGNKTAIENYRPIVILSNFGKLFEVVLYDILFFHVKSQISDCQHGFIAGRSTTTNLISVTQFIANTLDQGGQVDIVYTDLSKAFDRLDHGLLLYKMSVFGLTTDFLKFFQSYLSNRKLNVQYHGFMSEDVLATSGVPQGSVLGPLLFVVFINDINLDLCNNSLMYADDLKLFASIVSPEDCRGLQNDLCKINLWCLKNKLPLNIAKCNVMTFSKKHNPVNFSYSIDNITVNRCTEFKDLGVIFDTSLSFVAHIDYIVGNAYKNLGFIIRNSKHFTDLSTLALLFNSFVRSKLEYAAVVWNPQFGVHISNLERVQRKYVKYLAFKADGVYPARGTPQLDLLTRFRLDDLALRRVYFSILFLHKLLTYTLDCPEILRSICFNIPSFQTRSYSLFYLPTTRTNALKFSPVYNMCQNYLKYQLHFDILICSNREIKKCILGNF